MTEHESRALAELLEAIEVRVNRLEAALEIGLGLPIGLPEGFLSVGDRLFELGEPLADAPLAKDAVAESP